MATRKRQVRKAKTSEFRRILVLLGTRHGFAREMIRGITQFSREQANWDLRRIEPFPFLFQAATRDCIVEEIKTWKPHGILGHVHDRDALRAIKRLRRPFVQLFDDHGDSGTTSIVIDWRHAGKLAANFLRERGYRNFCFVGPTRGPNLLARDGFRETLARHQLSYQEALVRRGSHLVEAIAWREKETALARTIEQAGKPLAVYTSRDDYAMEVSQLCTKLGLRVPDDVGILGTGNDDIFTNLTSPALSSIRLPMRKIGHQGAATLDGLISRHKTSGATVELAPTGIAKRRSTDAFLHTDEEIANALDYVRRHSHLAIRVSDIAKHLDVSRSHLEKKFREQLEMTPLEAILRARIEAAEQQLANTDAPILDIAVQCGFSSHSRFCKTFREQIGETPSAYRARLQSR